MGPMDPQEWVWPGPWSHIPAKTQKTENSNLHGFELHRPISKNIKLLLQLIKAIIKQGSHPLSCGPMGPIGV
jgi:hypothetical protein